SPPTADPDRGTPTSGSQSLSRSAANASGPARWPSSPRQPPPGPSAWPSSPPRLPFGRPASPAFPPRHAPPPPAPPPLPPSSRARAAPTPRRPTRPAGRPAPPPQKRQQPYPGRHPPTLVPLTNFLHPIRRARRPRLHRLVRQVSLDVPRQTIGRLVAPRALLL